MSKYQSNLSLSSFPGTEDSAAQVFLRELLVRIDPTASGYHV